MVAVRLRHRIEIETICAEGIDVNEHKAAVANTVHGPVCKRDGLKPRPLIAGKIDALHIEHTASVVGIVYVGLRVG